MGDQNIVSFTQTALARVDRNWLRRFRRNTRRWYAGNARDLPWRRTRDPYRIWISEIMLQQTTVAAVVPYFERFIERFSTIGELAAGDEQEVLRYWEGLGYYSRARNIHKTAKLIAEEHAGWFPDDVSVLLNLPGIGRYTAGAIVSFAFDRPAAIVEANTLRLYCRLLGYDGDPRSSAGQRLMWDFARRLVPRRTPGRFNQALMELGATVCTPTDPACSRCPVRSCCRALADGSQDAIPVRAARPAPTDLIEAAVAIRKKGRYLLCRCEDGERWAGLWDFVRVPLEGTLPNQVPRTLNVSGALGRLRNGRYSKAGRTSKTAAPRTLGDIPAKTHRELVSKIVAETGLGVELGSPIAEIRHGVTRYRIRLICFPADYRSGALKAKASFRWVLPGRFGDYPLSTTGRQLATMLANGAGENGA